MDTDLFRRLATSQFLAALGTLNQSIQRCDEKTWVAEHIDTPVNQVVFHTLFYADLYLHDRMEGFKEQSFHTENPEFFQDYEEQRDKIPTNFYLREKCREYLQFCVNKAKRVIAGESEARLSGESGFHWRKCSRAELHIYNTRHIQHHAAQLGLRHQLIGGEPLDWVGEG